MIALLRFTLVTIRARFAFLLVTTMVRRTAAVSVLIATFMIVAITRLTFASIRTVVTVRL